MPKETTHLAFANTLLNSNAAPFADMAPACRKACLLGSVSPDTFYYGMDPKIEDASERMHGNGPDRATLTLCKVIENTRSNGTPADLAFCLGFSSHLALDTVFHPMIVQWAVEMNKHRPDSSVEYFHLLLETAMARDRGTRAGFLGAFGPLAPDHLAAPMALGRELGLARKSILKAYRLQYVFNLLFPLAPAHWAASLWQKATGRDISKELALFPAQVAKDPVSIPGEFEYFDHRRGGGRRVTPGDLWREAEKLALETGLAVAAYWNREMIKDDFLKILGPFSLANGTPAEGPGAWSWCEHERK